MDTPDEIRIILLGKSGAGKSKTGNTILGSEEFIYGDHGTSITSICQKASSFRFGKKIDVVDTPGVFDTDTDNADIQLEVKRSIVLSSPGPHAVILCIRIARFTNEDIETLQHYVKYFGEEMLKYVVVVFTHLDQLLEDHIEQKEHQTKQNFITSLPEYAKEFLKLCGNRYLFFNNRLRGEEHKNQVEDLLRTISAVQRDNRNNCFTNSDFKMVEQMIRDYTGETNESRDNAKISDDLFFKVIEAIGNLVIKILKIIL